MASTIRHRLFRVLVGAGLVLGGVGGAASTASANSGIPTAEAASTAVGGEQRITYTCVWGDICSIKPDGTGFRRLVKVADLGYAGPISPDGLSIAYWVNQSGYSGRLWVMASDGTDQHLVSTTLTTMYDAPTWSPNSRQLAYTQENNSGIGIVNVDGTGARTVISGDAAAPSWSPDGQWIAFTSNRSGSRDVWRIRPDGTGLTDLTNTPAVDDYAAGWSPDGQRLAYMRGNLNPTVDMWTMRSDGSDQRRLVALPDKVIDTGASYSPDGTQITFAVRPVSDPFADDIYTVNADGTDVRQITHNATFNRSPHWGVVATAPGAPRAVTATSAGTALSVAFSPPASDGGTPVVFYRAACVSSNGGTSRSELGVSSPIPVTKVTGLATYTCSVRAVNLAGTGPASHASAALSTPAGLAAAPTGATVTQAGGRRDVLVAFTPPALTGGYPIHHFKAVCTSSTGGTTRSGAATQHPALVTGLTAGATYRCSVQAANSAGLGPASARSAAYIVPR